MPGHDLQTLYRVRDGKKLLYIGVSGNWPRRISQHRAEKPWFTMASRVDLEWHPDRAAVLEAERRAIITEHPMFNVQHNRSRVTAEVAMDVSAANIVETLMFIVGLACLAAVGLQWAADAGSYWRQKRRAAREGEEVNVLPPRNPFTQAPPSALLTAGLACLTFGTAASAAGTTRQLISR